MVKVWEDRPAWAPTPTFSGIAAQHEIFRAWKDVRNTRGKAVGVDGVDKKTFRTNLKPNIERISEALTDGVYAPQPSFGSPIIKPDGDVRWLGIPTIRDRVVGRAMHSAA